MQAADSTTDVFVAKNAPFLYHPDIILKHIFDEIVQGFLKHGIIG